MFIIYGCVSSVSVGDIFIAGIIPGILMGISLMILSYIYCRVKGYKRTGEKPTLRKIGKATKDAIWALILPVIILGSIYGGIVTPTECAVLAVVYSFIIGRFVYKELTWEKIVKALRDTVSFNGMAMYMLGFAAIFSNFLAVKEIPQALSSFMMSLDLGPIAILLIVNLFLLVMGCFVENIPATIILTPILLPIVVAAGMHPVTFGVVITMNLAIGYITPPYGFGLFVTSMMGKIPFGSMLKPAAWMVLALTVVLALTTYVPWLTLGLLGY